ncbi:MAG: DUF4430 domain-containing protein [Clostridia bacterium]|nr:DUF4430 domain-containing protein [Clostridia bacterium]
MKKIISCFLLTVFIFMLASCVSPTDKETPISGSDETSSSEITLFSDALYDEDTTLGEGEKTVYLSVITPEKTVKFTVLTDKTVLGEALIDVNLIEGEEGPYGLYIKKVNGISAVYETDGAYWNVSIGGEASNTGIDGIKLADGGEYELTYTKA